MPGVSFGNGEKGQVWQFIDCCTADFGPPGSANPLYNKQKIAKLVFPELAFDLQGYLGDLTIYLKIN